MLDDAEVRAGFEEVRAAGVRIGLSATGPEQRATIDRALEVGGFDEVQATWNLHERSAEDALARAADAGLEVYVKEALANGRLTDRGAPPALLAAARERDTTPDALALAAALAQPWATVVLSGATTVEQLESNLAARDVVWEGGLEELAEDPEAYWSTRSSLAWNWSNVNPGWVGSGSDAGVNVGTPRASPPVPTFSPARDVNVGSAAEPPRLRTLTPPLAPRYGEPWLTGPVRPKSGRSPGFAVNWRPRKSMTAIATATPASRSRVRSRARRTAASPSGPSRSSTTAASSPRSRSRHQASDVVGAGRPHDLGAVGRRQPADQRRVRPRREEERVRPGALGAEAVAVDLHRAARLDHAATPGRGSRARGARCSAAGGRRGCRTCSPAPARRAAGPRSTRP